MWSWQCRYCILSLQPESQLRIKAKSYLSACVIYIKHALAGLMANAYQDKKNCREFAQKRGNVLYNKYIKNSK